MTNHHCIDCDTAISGANQRCHDCKPKHANKLRKLERKTIGDSIRQCSDCQTPHRSPGYCGDRCKDCHNKNAKKYNLAYYKRHPDRVIARSQEWAKNNPDHVKAYQKQWFETNREKQRQYAKVGKVKARKKVRSELIAAYGGKCACPRCPEGRIEFLTVDHVNGSGTKHRKSLGLQPGYEFYCWLRRHGFPGKEYQLLCFNCNCAKRDYAQCPHVKSPTFTNVSSSIKATRKAKAQVIAKYGARCSCQGCPEKGLDFLTVDHIYCDGATHRKKYGGNIYIWLRRNGFPKDRFQLLCFNCNCAKWCYGACPHMSSQKIPS